MQVALEGVPALAKLLFCLSMGRAGDLKSQLLLPPGMGVLRGALGELSVTPHPMLCQGQTCFAQP